MKYIINATINYPDFEAEVPGGGLTANDEEDAAKIIKDLLKLEAGATSFVITVVKAS